MRSDEQFSLNVLENMRDGVLTLDGEGMIRMFNPAAGAILGLDPGEVLGKRFAEVFLELEGNDDFNQAAFDAIYQDAVGLTTLVDFTRPDGGQVALSVTSSYLHGADGAVEKGVILVFTDVTELKALQQEQQDLNRKLTEAYVKLEGDAKDIEANARRGGRIRMWATSGVILLFVVLGVYFWAFGGSGGSSGGRGARSTATTGLPKNVDPSTLNTVTVRQQPVSATISLSGRLQPLEEVNVVAPFSGTVLRKDFEPGMRVEAGDVLLELNDSEIAAKFREARSTYIKARQKYQETKDWGSGSEMAKARRDAESARRKLQNSERKLDEAKMLFEKNIIPGTELESAEEEVRNARAGLKSALESLADTRERGSDENLEIVDMELKNAEENLKHIEEQMAGAKVRAPVSGVVLKHMARKDDAPPIEVGSPIKEGDVLFTVGNLQGMSIKTKVDEVDVGKIAPQMPVHVTGDAFPNLTLKGVIDHISAQASSEGGDAPGFDVTVDIPKMSEEEKQEARVGMTANLEVLVYNNPDAMLVPISAVHRRGDGHYVLVRDGDALAERTVTPGMTTVTSVEILSGLQPGDEIVVQ